MLTTLIWQLTQKDHKRPVWGISVYVSVRSPLYRPINMLCLLQAPTWWALPTWLPACFETCLSIRLVYSSVVVRVCVMRGWFNSNDCRAVFPDRSNVGAGPLRERHRVTRPVHCRPRPTRQLPCTDHHLRRRWRRWRRRLAADSVFRVSVATVWHITIASSFLQWCQQRRHPIPTVFYCISLSRSSYNIVLKNIFILSLGALLGAFPTNVWTIVSIHWFFLVLLSMTNKHSFIHSLIRILNPSVICRWHVVSLR